jgi:hypothetical protein
MVTETETWVTSLLTDDGRRLKVHGNLTFTKVVCILNYVAQAPLLELLEINDPDHFGDNEAFHIAEILKSNTSLRHINLSGNSITSKGVNYIADALEVNTVLTHLSIDKNSIGDLGAQVLANALKKNRSVRFINLSENKIGDIGAQALADMINVNEHIYELNVSYNSMTEVGKQAMFCAIRPDSTITVSAWNNIDDNMEGVKALPRPDICYLLSCRSK